jgi:hypothetical protein
MFAIEHNATRTKKDVALAYKLLTSTKVGVPHIFVYAFVLTSVIFFNDETLDFIEHSCKDMTKCSLVRIQPDINSHQKLLLITRENLLLSNVNIAGLRTALPFTNVGSSSHHFALQIGSQMMSNNLNNFNDLCLTSNVSLSNPMQFFPTSKLTLTTSKML